MDNRLALRHFSAGYGRKTILSDISFSIAPGELGVLLGSNGSGKSTLLKGICGLIQARGDCLLDGRQLQTLSGRDRARQVGYLAQRTAMDLALTGLEVVLMGYNPILGLLEHPSRAHKNHACALLEELGIGELAESDFQLLSEGQRQMLLFARTLVCEPKLLLLDEADSALDYRNRRRFFDYLHRLARERGVAVLLCTHDAALALNFGDRLLLMDNGHLAANILMEGATQAQLQKALSQIYGEVELIRYRERWAIVGGIE